MTHAKTKEGQAVASEMKRQEAGYWKARLWDHDAIAAAAISAARESEASGDFVPRSEVAPVPIHAVCLKCGRSHVDLGEWATKLHRSHLCEHCGHVWRPFEHYTVGVPPTPPAPTVDEREHCLRWACTHATEPARASQLALELLSERAAANLEGQKLATDLLTPAIEKLTAERAAAFAQGEAQGYERGLRHAAPIQRQAEADHVRALNAERRFDTLAAAARHAREIAVGGEGSIHSDEAFHEIVDMLDAALGLAPAPEEKS